MDNQSSSPEQIAAAYSGITCATTAIAAAGCALGAATLVAVKFWHHPLGQELTGLQTLSFIVLPLFASFIPVVVMFFFGGKSQDHSSGHGSH
jgi:hypothetical protein